MKARIVLTDGVIVEADGTAKEIADLTEALRRSQQVARPGVGDPEELTGKRYTETPETDESSGAIDLGDLEGHCGGQIWCATTPRLLSQRIYRNCLSRMIHFGSIAKTLLASHASRMVQSICRRFNDGRQARTRILFGRVVS